MESYNSYFQIALKAALQGGELLKEGYEKKEHTIHTKEGCHNIVTEYDYLIEELIVNTIKQVYPNHNFLCEERGKMQGKSQEICWIIDPIDGTVNFAQKIPFFAVSIAAIHKGEVFLGITYQPITNELFWAIKGEGAYLNGKRIFVSNVKHLKDAVIGTGFPYNLKENPENCIDAFLSIAKKGLPVRRLGAATLDLAYVAAGKLDAFWETRLGPWDCAAALLFIQEAKGKVSHWNGDPFCLSEKNQILASNGSFHNDLVKLFQNI